MNTPFKVTDRKFTGRIKNTAMTHFDIISLLRVIIYVCDYSANIIGTYIAFLC